MPDHVEIGRRRTVGAGQRAGIERAADDRPGLVGDALQEARIADILDEDGTNAPTADLPDEADDILRGRLRLGAEPLRRDEGQPVIAAEIPKRVMRGDDGPARLREVLATIWRISESSASISAA